MQSHNCFSSPSTTMIPSTISITNLVDYNLQTSSILLVQVVQVVQVVVQEMHLTVRFLT